MNPICDQVAERVALGEPIGEHADHAASCARCKRLVALPVELAASKREVDPGMGFSARITAGAQHRIVVRRRRRIAATAAASVAAAAAVVFVLTHQSGDAPVAFTPPALPAPNKQAVEPQHKKDPWKKGDVDDDVRALVHLANTERSSHLSADWGRIEKPLAPYRAVLKGNQP